MAVVADVSQGLSVRTVVVYREYHTDTKVHFKITMTEAGTQAALEKGLSTFFKMQSKISTSNMMLFNAAGQIEKYSSPEHILKDFYGLRLEYYEKRRLHLLKQAELQLQRISNKVCSYSCMC